MREGKACTVKEDIFETNFHKKWGRGIATTEGKDKEWPAYWCKGGLFE